MGTKVMKSEAVRVGWRDVIDDVSAGTDVLVERYNKPVAAVISYEIYMALQEEIEELHASRQAAAIREALRSGKLKAVPWEQVKAELRAAGLLDE